ncbi:hypothetical protein OEA41_007950 [Lepraria neglecta]|uniref:Uncharacterized protein n=1 Tax=Lepraria neglecta TaxID=209136 RepID=A0AAD9ZE53_9LECA|nr:hypothetical protein OEA41_007950 [Lepraria neglecta]
MIDYNMTVLHTPSTKRVKAKLPDRYQDAFDDEVARWVQEGHTQDEIEAHYVTHGPKDPEVNSYAGLRDVSQPMQDSLAAAQRRTRCAHRHVRQYVSKTENTGVESDGHSKKLTEHPRHPIADVLPTHTFNPPDHGISQHLRFDAELGQLYQQGYAEAQVEQYYALRRGPQSFDAEYLNYHPTDPQERQAHLEAQD